MAQEETALYRTSDIYFASYLCSLDIVLKNTESDEQNGRTKVIFVFDVQVKDLHRLKSSFFGGSGTVKAMKFVQNIRMLKSLCYT